MRAFSALPVDDDIVDRIMTFCPTFGTLQSMILVSKAFYAVFQTHPKVRLAYNIVGPVLPQALRLIRYPYWNLNPDGTATGLWTHNQHSDPETMATTCPEEHSPSVITAEEKKTLQENSKEVETLEDIYSLTQKDRTSRTSVLTSIESMRFRRAVYRIWHYSRLFSSDRFDLDELEELGEDGVKRIQRQRTAVLREYPTDELQQLYTVVRFMRGILKGICDEEDNLENILDILLAVGPSAVTRAWEYRDREAIEDDIGFPLYELDGGDEVPLYKGYYDLPLGIIWAARKVTPPKEDDPAVKTKWILDEVRGANDTCSQCATPGGLTLLTEANWHRLTLPPIHFLKNNLKNNTSVTVPFAAMLAPLQQAQMQINDVAPDDWVGAWISSVFDAGVRQRTTSSGTGAEWDGWDKDKSYCQPCLTKFLEEHVWRWLLEERVKGASVCLTRFSSLLVFFFSERAGTATTVERWCTGGRMRMERIICASRSRAIRLDRSRVMLDGLE
ncbi:hypothetical protein DFH09DRAFT_1177761 [Mycena vulgaris]|nr:hypothetical protein DFH09DRAFT_1191796 [Mycena vulgaris]KAJ6538182.1 hypothetical protein DFH09DRAFT_1177761 [Mycena vulgaris]